MSEIFDIPNRATGPREVWERESDGECFAVHPECCDGSELVYRHLKSKSLGYWGYLESLPPGRYRIRTIPDSPWPPKTRIEKRRVIIYRDDFGCTRVAFEMPDSGYFLFNILFDEIRDCEIEDGKVVRVIPLKEGE